jgi:UDP-N-acetylmuramyl tripeptide synthase
MQSVLNLIKKILGDNLTKQIRPLGHGIKAVLAKFIFSNPSKKLYLIGITGTKGKTTTTVMTGRLLNKLGIKTGYISTSVINYGGSKDHELLNKTRMGMLDAIEMQKVFSKMVKNGCTTAVVEVSSEGLSQNRHLAIEKFNIGVFLNIYPEHLETHGSFDNYLMAKAILFQNLKNKAHFLANGNREFSKNIESIWFSIKNRGKINKILYDPQDKLKIIDNKPSIYQNFENEELGYVVTDFMAEFEIHNALFAYQIAKLTFLDKGGELKFTDNIFDSIGGVPGRMEWVVWEDEVIENEN